MPPALVAACEDIARQGGPAQPPPGMVVPRRTLIPLPHAASQASASPISTTAKGAEESNGLEPEAGLFSRSNPLRISGPSRYVALVAQGPMHGQPRICPNNVGKYIKNVGPRAGKA